MFKSTTRRHLAERYHRLLPEDIRRYLNGRGIPDAYIDRQLLGWNGSRITIPVRGREGGIVSFRLAKRPGETSDAPKVLSEIGTGVELYGWETLASNPNRVVICEGEFDRLVLEANGFPAVTSTAGAGVFLPDWAPSFAAIRHVYVCFDRDAAGEAGALNVKRFLPQAKVVRLPEDVGPKGDITDYFVRLGKTRVDFEMLLANAAAAADEESQPAAVQVKRPKLQRKAMRRVTRLKETVRLEDVLANYTDLRRVGAHLVGRCPFHEDKKPSFVVYPETQTYVCFGCRAHGDVIALVMQKESITFHEAVALLERYRDTHEFFGTAA
jgi:hypothetical protein